MWPMPGTQAGVRSLAELLQKELIVGATAPGTTLVDFPLVTNKFLGTRFRVVRGYDSTPQINVAMERGEVEGIGGIGWQSVKTTIPQWIAEKKITVIAQYGLQRDPDLAAAPTMLELAKTDADRAGPDHDVRAHRIRPALFRAARRAGRAGRSAAARLRRHHEGSGIHRRRRAAAAGI